MDDLSERYRAYWGSEVSSDVSDVDGGSGSESEVQFVSMPDAPPALILSLIKDAIAVAVAFGLSLSTEQQIALMAFASSTTLAIMFWDASIRKHRNAVRISENDSVRQVLHLSEDA